MHLLSVAASTWSGSATTRMPINPIRLRMGRSMLARVFVVLQRHLLLEFGFLFLRGQGAATGQTLFVGIRALLDKLFAEQGVAQEIQAEVEQGLVVGDQ